MKPHIPWRWMPLLGFIWLSLHTPTEIYQRLRLEVHGTVTAQKTECNLPYHNRCVTTYQLRTPEGTNVTYSAGFVDHDLRQPMKDGDDIEKKKWVIDYRINGVRVEDFPWKGYLVFPTLALLYGLGLWMWLRRQKARQWEGRK